LPWGIGRNRDRLTDKQKDFISEGWPVEIVHFPDQVAAIAV
jgi:hypothetical protein